MKKGGCIISEMDIIIVHDQCMRGWRRTKSTDCAKSAENILMVLIKT